MGAINRLILIDTGPLYAYVDPNDQYHDRALDFLRHYTGTVAIRVLVIPEVAHFLRSRAGTHAESRFLQDIASRDFIVESVELGDWRRIIELVEQYRDLPLGTVDASIIAAAERLNIRTIATFDRRHFTVVRPAHVETFELVP